MLTAAILSPSLPLLFASGALILLIPWLLRLPRAALGLLLASLVLGQVWRGGLPGQGGGILASDMAVVCVIGVAVLQAKRASWRPALPWLGLILPFLFWSGFTLVLNVLGVSWPGLLIGAA